MSRALRRYRRWERQARKDATEDARQLALELYEGRPGPASPYGIGVVLEPGEVVFRQVWARYATLVSTPDLYDTSGGVRPGSPSWREWGWGLTLVTSDRLVARLGGDGGRLVSVWWSGVGGLQVDLAKESVVMDASNGDWRGRYGGPLAPVLAVAAVERVYGAAALLDHPGLAPLREHSMSDEGVERSRLPSARGQG
jgi:hypothetical protein